MKKAFTILAVATCATIAVISCDDNSSGGVNTPQPIVNSCLPAELQNGLIAYYPFSGGSFNDVVQNNPMSFITEVATEDRAGNPKCAVAFTGDETDSYLASSSSDFLNNLTQLSISLWYKPESVLGDSPEFQTLIGRGEGLRCPDTDGQWSIGLYDNRQAVFGHGNSIWEIDDAAGTFTGWKHVTATWNQVDNSMKIYINGVLVNSDTGIADCGNGPVTVADEGTLVIGRHFKGKIDDVAIYNRELSAAEAAQLYQLAPCCQ